MWIGTDPVPSHVLCLNLSFLSDPSPKSTLLVPAYSNRIWSNAWTNILVVFLVNFLVVFVYVLWVCFKCRFCVFVLVVYLHLFSAAYGNKAFSTTFSVCLNSPHHKALDSVNHDILFTTLRIQRSCLGVPTQYFKWQKTKINPNKTPSETQSISYGLPPGSNLGALLFRLNISDIQSCIANSDLRLFADDTAFFLYGDDPETIIFVASNEPKIWCNGITPTN